MTNEEYRQKMLTLDRREKELEEQENELNRQIRIIKDKQNKIRSERWEVDGEYAESVTGFKIGEVVKVSGYHFLKPFKMIIDKMCVETKFDEPRSLCVYGRRMTNAGTPVKTGTSNAEMIYNDSFKHGDIIEHIL